MSAAHRLADRSSNLALPHQQFPHHLSASVFSCVKRGCLCRPDKVDVRATRSDVSKAEPGSRGGGFGIHSDVLSVWTFCWGFGLPPSEAGRVEMFATFWGGDKSSEESKARCGKFFCTEPDVITCPSK